MKLRLQNYTTQKLYTTKVTQQGYTTKLYYKVTQLSSYHLTNKEVHYLHTAESQDNILPRGGPIQNPYPLSWKQFPTVQSYTVKVTQRRSYTIT